MKHLRILCLILVVLVTLVFSGCTGSTPSTSALPTSSSSSTTSVSPTKVYTLSLGTFHPPEGSISKAFLAWFNWLEKESKGRIKMTMLPAAQAAAPDQLYDAARTGIVDIADHHLGMSPGRFPLMDVIDLPFMFKTPASRSAGLTALTLLQKYPEIQSEFSDVKPLSFHFTDAGHVWTINKQVKTMEDINSLLLLAVSKYASESLKLVGANPQRSDPSSMYDMLAKKVVDGVVIDYEAVTVTFNIIDVLNYVTEFGFGAPPFVVVMNLNTWNSLPADLQQLFVGENAYRLTELMGYDFDNITLRVRDEADKILKARGYPGVYVLSDAEKVKWIQTLMPVQDQYIKQAAAIVGDAKAKAILNDAKALAEQYRYETTPFDQSKQTLHDWGHSGY
jgi:TRAP-type C4-dicarboxylate transport system substrate-binding protein